MEIIWGGAEAEPQDRWWWSGDLRQMSAALIAVAAPAGARHVFV